MASPEDAGLVPNLAKPHCGRPKYARVISWELSRDVDEDPAEKRKKRRSYERKMRKEKRIVEHRREQKPEPSGEELDSSSSASEADSEEELAAVNDGENVTDVKKEVPNMGKKAKNRHSKETFELGISELSAIDLLDKSEIVGSNKPIEEFVVQNRPVPSLVDLCLRVDWKVHDSECEIKISDIAPGLRDLVRTKQQMCRLNAQHLKCYHRILARREKFYEDFIRTDPSMGDDKNAPQILERGVSSVFHMAISTSGYRSVETLTRTFMEEGGYRFNEGVLDDLVQTIDLMLPPVVRTGSKMIGRANSHSMSKLKFALKKRYPKLIEYVFDEAVPYVWWSRGNYGLAEEAFLHLAAKHKGTRLALYLNELGRLHLYQDDPDIAVSYFKEAESILHSASRETNDAITVQTLILCANAYDQGILNRHKADRSQNFWTGALKCYGVPASAIRRAVESLLNTHLCSISDDYQKLKSMRDSLAKYCQKSPVLNYHLSCMNTILDDEMLANYSLKDTAISPTLWTPVFEQKRKGVLPTMKVVWRTKLLTTVEHFVDDSNLTDAMDIRDWQCHVADVDRRPLQLRLTRDGYLTGNIRMFLPALRSVLLDPHTGMVSFPEVPLRPESLTGATANTTPYLDQSQDQEWDRDREEWLTVYCAKHFTLQLMWECKGIWELNEWPTKPFYTLPGELMGELTVICMKNAAFPYHYTLLEATDGRKVEYYENKYVIGYSSPVPQNMLLKLTTAEGDIHQLDVLALVRRTDYLQMREAFMRYEEKKPKEQKRKWKKNRKKTDREIEEENLTYYEREFKRRSDEYMGSEQWKKDSLSWLRKIYQQGSEFRGANRYAEYEFNIKLKEELEKDPQCKLKYKKYKRAWGYVNDETTIGSWYFHKPTSIETGYFATVKSFKVYGNTVALLVRISNGDLLIIVNCKDEKTFGDPKVYLPHRVMQNRYLNQDMEWAHEPIEPDEDILMIPTSLDNCHPDAKVIGLYQFTYAWRKHVNKLYIFDEDGKVLRQNTLPHTGQASSGRLELRCVIGTQMYGITFRGDRVYCDKILYSTTSQKFTQRLIQIQSFKETLILGTSTGLAFMNKDMKLCKLDATFLVSRSKSVRAQVSEDGYFLSFEGDNTAEYKCTILNRAQAQSSNVPLIIAHNCHVILLGNLTNESVNILQHAELPGRATEAHYISKKVGFVVSFTLSGDEDGNYREHVLHFDPSGTVQSILPFMSHGPRDFFSIELAENKEVRENNKQAGRGGWHMYLNDGHGGIMCIYFED